MTKIEAVGNDGWKLIGKCYLCSENREVTMKTSLLSGSMYPICLDCVERYDVEEPRRGLISRLFHKISGGP